MTTPIPPELKAKVLSNLEPVKPVAPPAVRLVLVALWGLAALVGVPALVGLRFNASELGFWLLWGATAGEALAGLLLVFLALREGIPGLGASRGVVGSALAAAFLVELGVALLTHARCPCPARFGPGVACFASETLLGIPALVLTLFLVVRAYPLSPPRAGLLGGVGAGLLADALQHLVCPVSDPRHVLVWHLGAVILLGLLGLGLGLLWQARRVRSLKEDLEGKP